MNREEFKCYFNKWYNLNSNITVSEVFTENLLHSIEKTETDGDFIFEDGFCVDMNKAFLSRPFCMLYASRLIKEYGTWNYQSGSSIANMDIERISENLFACAIGCYAPNAINKVNAYWGQGWLNNDLCDDLIYIRKNEEEHIVKNYKKIWDAAPSIRNYAWSSGVFIIA